MRPRRSAQTGPRPRPQPGRGVGAIAVIVVLVGVAVLAAAIARLGVSTATTTAQDMLGARASAAARAGVEWGLYQAFKGSWTSCSGASQQLDLRTDTGMRVSVSCSSALYNEGESSPGTPATVRIYSVEAIACNGAATSCPDASSAVQAGYIERRRQVQATN